MSGTTVAGAGRRQTRRALLLVLAGYVLCVVVHLAASRFDVTRFIVAGDRFVDAAHLTYPIAVVRGSEGYDGQYFYRMALAPFDADRHAYGISMENHPAVRAQRIVYPVLAWAIGLGHGAVAPIALIVVNLGALVALAWVALRLAAGSGVPGWTGLAIPFYPGFVLSLCRDTAEIVATALALGGLLAARAGRWPVAVLLASLAVLTREVTLLYLAGYGLVAAWRSVRTRSFDRRVAWCLIPVLVYGLWQLHIKSVWGSYAFGAVGHDDFTPLPFRDFVAAAIGYATLILAPPFRYSVLYALAMGVAFAALLAFVAARWRRASVRPAEIVVPWLGFTLMAICFSQAVWRDPWGYVRILNDFFVLSVVLLIVARDLAGLRRLMPLIGLGWLATLAYVV